MESEDDKEVRGGLTTKSFDFEKSCDLNIFVKLEFKITRERLNRDVAFLAGQITMLEQAAMREEEKIEDLKLKCEMFR